MTRVEKLVDDLFKVNENDRIVCSELKKQLLRFGLVEAKNDVFTLPDCILKKFKTGVRFGVGVCLDHFILLSNEGETKQLFSVFGHNVFSMLDDIELALQIELKNQKFIIGGQNEKG